MKNSREEAYATETGLVLAEISYTIKRLRKWMKSKRTKTNFLNFFSSTHFYHDLLPAAVLATGFLFSFCL